jgi:hypothetical protein
VDPELDRVIKGGKKRASLHSVGLGTIDFWINGVNASKFGKETVVQNDWDF